MMNISQKLLLVISGAAIFLCPGLVKTNKVRAASLNNTFGLSNPSTVITFSEFIPQPPFTIVGSTSRGPIRLLPSITTEYSNLGIIFKNLYYSVLTPSRGISDPEPIPNFEGAGLVNTNAFAPPGFSPFQITYPVASIKFLQNQSQAAFALLTSAETTALTALLDGVPIESFSASRNLFPGTSPPIFTNNFYGFTDITFNEIQINTGTPANVTLDNLQLSPTETESVPESSSLAGILALGIIGAVSLRKHKYSS